MSRLLDFWQHERDQAESLSCGLKAWRGTSPSGKPTLKLWRPNAIKPYAHYVFRDQARLEAFLAQQVAGYVAQKEMLAERKLARQGKLSGVQLEPVEVGSIFQWSWGYDQSNIDYFQVTEKKGRQVVVGQIGAATVPGSQGVMSAQVMPLKDNFLGGHQAKSLTKLLQYSSDGRAYLAFEFGWCGLWRGGPAFTSWSH